MKRTINFLVLFLFILNANLDLRSQVTIGSGIAPNNGALLDVKETNVIDGGDNSTKGILFPRVKLTDMTKLSPMFSGADLDDTAQKLNHKGLVVYNTNAAAPFVQGLYYWDGTLWISIVSMSASNGLTLDSTRVKLGGSLTESTTINQSNKELVIDNTGGGTFKIEGMAANASIQGATPAIDIVGKVRMTTPGELAGTIKRMVINQNGEVAVETPATVQSLLTYAQSPTTQIYAANSSAATTINSGAPLTVTFNASDIVVNTISTFNDATDEFVINTPGLYEVSGYVNYMPYSNGSNYTTLNVVIQYKESALDTWKEYSLSRMVFTGKAMQDIASTIVIPAAAMQMQADYRIRMIFVKPLGDNQGNYGSSTWGIVLPTGGKYSKAIKIKAI